MRCKRLFLGGILSSALLGMMLSAPAQAQPDENNAPKGANPPNWNWNPGGGGGNRGVPGGRPLRLPLTAEQLRLLREQRTEARAQNIKGRLTGAGFTDEALQTAIVTEFKAQDGPQSDLLEKWQKINQALLINQTPVAGITAMLKDVRDAVAKEKTRRTAAMTALETQFQISQKPVLDALLMTMGITGDEAEFVSQTTGAGFGQILTLPAIRRLVDGAPIANVTPRIHPGNDGLKVPLGEIPAGNNGDGPPNAAPPADARKPTFF